MSGHAFRIFLRSSLAQTMNAFIGRLMCGLPVSSRRGWRTSFAFSASSDGDWFHDDAEILKCIFSICFLRLQNYKEGFSTDSFVVDPTFPFQNRTGQDHDHLDVPSPDPIS